MELSGYDVFPGIAGKRAFPGTTATVDFCTKKWKQGR